MAFMGHNGEEDGTEVSETPVSPQHSTAAEENHGTPTKQHTSEIDASEVAETTQSPKHPSKLEDTHSISTESVDSKVDVSEQPRTPQTPALPSAAEQKNDSSTESSTPKGDASEVTEPSPTHPPTANEDSSETTGSFMQEDQHHQDSEHSCPSDEASPNHLRESGGDTSDVRVPSPANLDESSNMEMEGSIQTGKEDMSDANDSQSQLADTMPGNVDDVNEDEVKIVQESDVQTDLDATKDSSDTVDKVTHLEIKVNDENIDTNENDEESNQMKEGVASAVVHEDNTRDSATAN